MVYIETMLVTRPRYPEFSRGDGRIYLFDERGISERSGDAETLVIRINECRAFISLLKGSFECAKEGGFERAGIKERSGVERKGEREVDHSRRPGGKRCLLTRESINN